MSKPLVVVDADVLGRHRTGDETYIEQLLRALPAAAPDLRIAAVTRRPDLVPAGVEPIELAARSQELRMAVTLPRLLRRLRPALGHFVHAVPLRCPCPAVLTVQDLSFERDPTLMRRADRLVFKTVVPWSARRAAALLAISERTKRDLVELYGIRPEKVTVTLLGVDPIYRPGPGPRDYLLFVGAIEPRKDPLTASRAAREAGLPLVVVGPVRDEAIAAQLRAEGADLRGYVTKEELAELYRGAACLVWSSRFEGFGLPILEAMASATPVVATPERAVQEVAGDAALFAEPAELGAAVRRALAERDRLAAAGLERAWAYSWDETARLTAAVYRRALEPLAEDGSAVRRREEARDVKVSAVVVSHGHAAELEESLPALAPQVDELVVVANVPGSVGVLPPGARVVENERPLGFAANVNRGIAAANGAFVVVANPDAVARDGAVAALVAFAESCPRAGIVGPQLVYPDGSWQPSRRRFPTVGGTVVRRTPLRLLYPPFERQRSHYLLDERPGEPVEADWMLGAFLLLRRSMLDEIGGFDEGFRMYGEDIDLCYRAMRAGWERWYVPGAVVGHAYAAVIDKRFLTRRTLWHWRGIARFVRKHPERLRVLR